MLPKFIIYNVKGHIACNGRYLAQYKALFQSSGSVQLEPRTFETELRPSPKTCRSDIFTAKLLRRIHYQQ